MNNMESQEFLKYLINEDIYSVDKGNPVEAYENAAIESPQVAEPIAEVKQEAEVETKPAVSQYKSILVIVEDESSDGLNNKDKQYLAKILSAVKADLYSISLVNIHKNELQGLDGVENILVFTDNSSLKAESSKYDMADYSQAKIILSDPLDKVSESVELRKQLWGALQKMFV
jgi:hypothetical protein